MVFATFLSPKRYSQDTKLFCDCMEFQKTFMLSTQDIYFWNSLSRSLWKRRAYLWILSLHPSALPQHLKAENQKEQRKALHKPVAVDTAFLPWLRGLVPASPLGSAGGREGRTTAQGRGCSAAPGSEGYCPCHIAGVSSWPLDPLGCPVNEQAKN